MAIDLLFKRLNTRIEGVTMLNEDRLFPADPGPRAVARRLYESVRDLPIVSPHGHTCPQWFARNEAFPDPARLFVVPDHYVFRMLYSQGVPLEALGVGPGATAEPRQIWRLFASHYHLFRGTPTRIWMDYAFERVFGMESRLSAANADQYYDAIAEQLQTPAFRPRALLERFRIEVLATTDSPLDSLDDHRTIQAAGLSTRILPTFRPDPVVDPDFEGFAANIARLGEITGKDTSTWLGYLDALRETRERFKQLGCTATDHGHPTPATADLDATEASALFGRVLAGDATAAEKELFRAQMLTEMAAMSLDDGLVMQIHPGSHRNHNPQVYRRFGRDVGSDIPMPTEYVRNLQPLLTRFGNEAGLTIVLFTLDESTYSRELAPLAGHYPCLRLGPAWWFHDSPEGMMRFREMTTETAGFYNTVGFNDDTRALLSIPARHDVARRVDCAYLARLVAEHRLDEEEAAEVAYELTNGLVKRTYRL
ncbi:MAG: glucuronate isomerase [Terracidiphilus sp.]